MSNVIDLLGQADKVAVDLYPLDQMHAEATRELADLEARIDAARAKARASLDAKASLSARFEAIVKDLEAAGVDRVTVQKAVDERIAFLLSLGAIKPAPIPAVVALPSVPAAPVAQEPKREEPKEPAKVIDIESARPDPVLPPTTPAPVAAPVETPAAQQDTADAPTAEEEPVIELPLRRSAETQASVLPAARQRRPRTVPAAEPPQTAAEPVAEPSLPVVEPVVEPVAAEAPVLAEPAMEVQGEGEASESISHEVYGSVLSGLDGDEDVDGHGDAALLPESAQAEAEPVSEEPVLEAGTPAAAEPDQDEEKVAEPAPVADVKKDEPADDGDAFIPAFLRS